MRPFLYALTFALGLCLLLPAPARGRGALGGYDEPREPTKEELRAQKEADKYGEYFVGSIATIVSLVVVVQFVREVRGNAPPVRVVTYSARTDSYDGMGSSYDGSGSRDGTDSDSRDEYDSRYETDF